MSITGGVFLVLFSLATESEEEEEEEESGDAQAELSNFKFAMQMFDILTTSLPTKYTFSTIKLYISKYAVRSLSTPPPLSLSLSHPLSLPLSFTSSSLSLLPSHVNPG
jgi:hypothetical protein